MAMIEINFTFYTYTLGDNGIDIKIPGHLQSKGVNPSV
jgi:hypothetical protein